MPDRPIRCPYNQKLKCWIAREKTRERACPLNDRAFIEDVDVWAFTNRTPKSVVDLGIDPSYGAAKTGDSILVEKAEMYCNFRNGTAVCEFVTGERPMNKDICKDMIAGRKKWQKKKDEG